MILRKITTEVVQKYVDSLSTQPKKLATSTIKSHGKVLRQFFGWAVIRNHIKTSPVVGVKFPKVVYPEIEVFDTKEISLLIEAARPKWLGKAIEIAFRTGMRRGEVFGLKWSDIDFEHGFLSVRRSVSALDPHEYYINEPKTKTSVRRIMMDPKLISLLLEMKKYSRSEWVMENQYGELINPWNVTKYMKSACLNAGIKHRSFHKLRHTHATLLLAENVHPKIVQERLGHSNINMTLTVYSHCLPSMQQIAVDAISKF